MTGKIGSLNVDVTMETARFKAGAKQVKAEASKLEKSVMAVSTVGGAAVGALAGFGTAVVIGGLQEAVAGAFELASSMSEAAGRIGVTVEALQALRVAATDNGVSNEALESSFGRLNVQLGDLQAGSKTAASAFAAIGLSAAQLKGLSPDEAFGAIADKIAAIKDPTLQAAAAQDIFGKSYAQLLPLIKGGSAALKEAADESRRNGQISTQDAKDLDYLADSWEKLKVRVGVATAQIIARAARMPGEIKAGFQQIGAFFTGIADSLKASVSAFVTVGKEIVNGLVRGIRNAPGAVADALKGIISTGISNAKALLGIKSPSRVFMEIGEFTGEGLALGIESKGGRVSAATRKLVDRARETAAELRSLYAELFADEALRQDNLRKFASIDEGQRTGLLSADQADRFRGALATKARGEVPLSDGLLDTPAIGVMGEGIDKLLEKITGLGDRAKVTTVQVAKSFKDMATDTLQSISGLANAIKSGGFLGILEAVIGIGLQLAGAGVFGKKVADRVNLPKYATGTSSAARGLALVGERGPELVNFRGGERVYNNRDSMGMMGGLRVEVVANNNGFGAIVRNYAGQVVAEASPSLMDGAARVANSRFAYQQSRRVA